MDWAGFIANAPDILLLIVPGYVATMIKEKLGLEQKHTEFDVVLFSFLYSFIISTIYNILKYLLVFLIGVKDTFFEIVLVKQICFILLGVLLGLFLIKVPKSKIGSRVRSVFNNSVSPEPSVWLKAMRNPNGAWATVYLNNGLIYTGQLRNYTSDYNDEVKEILLTNFRLAIKNDKSINSPKDFCTTIVDNTRNEMCKVYLKRDDILSIEIFENNEPASD